MLPLLAVAVDVLHATLMVVWIAGIPLLFVHRWPRATLVYAVYSVTFVVVSQLTQMWLGECFLTTIARALVVAGGGHGAAIDADWFTVRCARAIFGLAPSRRAISIAFDALVGVSAAGVLFSTLRHRRAIYHHARRTSRWHAALTSRRASP